MRSGSRVIHVRAVHPPLRRTAWGAVTVIAWGFYAYLWLPFATAAMWWFGLRDMYGELYERSEQLDPFVIAVLPVVATLSASLLVLWAEYNRRRFTGRERRAAFPDVPVGAIADSLGAAPGVATAIAESRIATVEMDEAARPVAVDTMAAAYDASPVA